MQRPPIELPAFYEPFFSNFAVFIWYILTESADNLQQSRLGARSCVECINVTCYLDKNTQYSVVNIVDVTGFCCREKVYSEFVLWSCTSIYASTSPNLYQICGACLLSVSCRPEEQVENVDDSKRLSTDVVHIFEYKIEHLEALDNISSSLVSDSQPVYYDYRIVRNKLLWNKSSRLE